MTTCKSIGYEVYRINFRCKCVCHKLKTTTELPFFVWRTNGTTRKIPKTFSPQLYHVVGTISATPIPKTTTVEAEDTDGYTGYTCNNVDGNGSADTNDSSGSNATTNGDGGGGGDGSTGGGGDVEPTGDGNDVQPTTVPAPAPEPGPDAR